MECGIRTRAVPIPHSRIAADVCMMHAVRWVTAGSIVMAALAALALAATVLFAERALSDASDVIVRGEGDALLSAVAADLAARGAPPTAHDLEEELETHRAAGLRYVAVFEGPRVVAEAGTARMPDAMPRPGHSAVLEKRVRVTGPLFPPRRPFHRFDRPPGPPPMTLLALELEPPVIEKLRGDLARIGVVGAVAGVVLIAFAIAWSRSARRLALIEARAAREQRLVALGSMSSVMAHELRNPLASLKGHAQLLVEDLEHDDKKRARAERVVAEAERLELLTTSLLDFVRDGPLEIAPVAPADLIAQAMQDLPAERVEVDVGAAPAKMRVDRTRLARALHNVIENAILATPDHRVGVDVSRAGSDVTIRVRDRGPGIPAGSEEKIFEPFMTTRTRGTGLGLAVARRIAEQHRGTLSGENDPAGGAVFRLSLPGSAEA
jgi:two-component system sensor histidine kinase HydH